MANETTQSHITTYDPEKSYHVKTTRVVKVFNLIELYPLDDHIFQGQVLNELIAKEGADVIHSAAEV